MSIPRAPAQFSLNGSWIDFYVGLRTQTLLAAHSPPRQYLAATFWVSTTISTAGLLGNMNPNNPYECLVIILEIILNLTVFSYALGEVSDAVVSQDAVMVATRDKILAVEKMIEGRKLPDELSIEIRRHFEMQSALDQADTADEDVFNSLSRSLQVDVAKNVSRAVLGTISIFYGCTDQFLDSMAVLLRESTINPSTYMYRVNDVSTELYIISSGMRPAHDPASPEHPASLGAWLCAR